MNTQDQLNEIETLPPAEEIKNRYPVELLHREWLALEPEKVKGPNGQIMGYLYGCKNFTKMKMFSEKVKLTNEKIDFWMHISPSCQEGETYEDYKIRMKFQKSLLKYREYIYSFPNK